MEHSLLQSYFTKTAAEKRRSDVIAYLAALDHLLKIHPSIAHSILQEIRDQRLYLKLIASENYTSLSTQIAMGNLLTDKYCEGFPFHRFYAGCENVDSIEAEAVKLAQTLFGVEHAYVQPHSGADANLVAFWSILSEKVQSPHLKALEKTNLDELSPEEFETLRKKLCNQTLMGLSLSSGGHLSHGFRQNISAKMFRAVPYDVDPKTHLLDYSQIRAIAKREKPLILLAGYSAYPRHINFAKMREIADEVGAVLVVDMAHFAGLVAGGAFKGENSPIGYAQMITTTTHKTLRGPRGGLVLCDSSFAEAVDRGCPLVLGGPLPHVIAAKAIAFQEAAAPEFAQYAQRIVENARALAEGLKKRGITVVTGGTDNHLVLIDISSLGLTGRIAETALREAGLTMNRNMVPFDSQGAWYTSGLRIGTPALTTLGMGPSEMDLIANLMVQVLQSTKPQVVEKTGAPSKAKGKTDQKVIENTKGFVKELLQRFPLYPELGIV